jgi:hypothetical protein
MDYTEIKAADLPYRHQFDVDELDLIKQCHDAHGFAVVRQVISPGFVEILQDSVLDVLDPMEDLGAGETRVQHAFIEYSNCLWQLLENKNFMAIHRRISATDELTLNRSAAILKNTGAPPVRWHTDWAGFHRGAARNANDVLNSGEWPSGLWFYLNGTHPSRAGLAVIADSHQLDWDGPEGFVFTDAQRRSFYRSGEPLQDYDRFDVPGLVPLFTEPGDLIIFAARTYHGAFSHGGDQPRLSVGLNLRHGRIGLDPVWPLPRSAARFSAGLPRRLFPYVEHYAGYDAQWQGEDQ